MRLTKLLKVKKKNLKRKKRFLSVKRKALEKEIWQFKLIQLIFVSFFKRTKRKKIGQKKDYQMKRKQGNKKKKRFKCQNKNVRSCRDYLRSLIKNQELLKNMRNIQIMLQNQKINIKMFNKFQRNTLNLLKVMTSSIKSTNKWKKNMKKQNMNQINLKKSKIKKFYNQTTTLKTQLKNLKIKYLKEIKYKVLQNRAVVRHLKQTQLQEEFLWQQITYMSAVGMIKRKQDKNIWTLYKIRMKMKRRRQNKKIKIRKKIKNSKKSRKKKSKMTITKEPKQLLQNQNLQVNNQNTLEMCQKKQKKKLKIKNKLNTTIENTNQCKNQSCVFFYFLKLFLLNQFINTKNTSDLFYFQNQYYSILLKQIVILNNKYQCCLKHFNFKASLFFYKNITNKPKIQKIFQIYVNQNNKILLNLKKYKNIKQNRKQIINF
ncbi:hypothetical protein TTHERM_000730311 (macronuclear) [Tetrahymena thermophila SB210]|uniref:Uncharacterized protein n=1 Tax=Tetrahymena thermophila (strain SB210) TaxID=312017 RepID=W7X6W5_TETTS|nr:hypothetical protein TTHERM_000730311 [Tetrahymena thermophila SB210]EWS72128.1 hypothetical protein TTHERM_000730311 [Tetrahymena thermophila SB210]|eukprot:XP_012655321.1 hypothetical protein TTHERM_000730311 [Tetrahymena thermophila SB210]